MKQLLKISAFAILAMSLFTFGTCKTTTLVLPYTGTFDVVLTANPAGTKTFSKDQIDNAVVKFLTDQKINVTNVSSIELVSVVATIPSTSALDFGQMNSASFSLGGSEVANITSPPAGKTLTQKVIKTDVKAALLADKMSYGLTVVTNVATVAETVKVTYKVNIGYSL
jgi:hypothetical protein